MFSARRSSWSKPRRLATAGLALVAVLALAGCTKTYEWRNKYVATVETASGPVSGASVIGETLLDRRANPQFGSGNVWDFAMKGEAVTVDLGEDRYLFVLAVRNEYLPLTVAARALGIVKGDYADAARRMDELKDPVALERRDYPLLVTFDDIADPKTVRRVDPDDLDGAFGLCPDGSGLKDADAPWRAEKMIWLNWARWQASGLSREAYRQKYEQGYPRADWIAALDAKVTPRDRSGDCRRLAAITLEITDEPVTDGRVERVLGWWCDYRKRNARLNGSTSIAISTNELSDILGTGAFRIGDCT